MTILYVAAALACALHMMQRLADAAVARSSTFYLLLFFQEKQLFQNTRHVPPHRGFTRHLLRRELLLLLSNRVRGLAK